MHVSKLTGRLSEVGCILELVLLLSELLMQGKVILESSESLSIFASHLIGLVLD